MRDAISLSKAAKLECYSRSHLSQILQWHGVVFERAETKVNLPVYVSRAVVREAIAAWNRLESMSRAARRLGISRNALRRLMHEAGVHHVGGKTSAQWHPPEFYDALIQRKAAA